MRMFSFSSSSRALLALSLLLPALAWAGPDLAGPGQPRQAGATVEQLHAKLAFQVAHCS